MESRSKRERIDASAAHGNLPAFEGLRRDVRMAEELRQSMAEELSAFCAYTERAILLDGKTKPGENRGATCAYNTETGPENDPFPPSNVMEEIARAELSHFRGLGELVAALGGDPAVNARIRTETCRWGRDPVRAVLAASVAEERAACEHFRALVGVTRDPVVRNYLLRLAAEEETHIRMLLECGERMETSG